MAPLDCTERICSAQMASLAQRLRVLRLVLGDLATRNAAIAREEAGYEEGRAWGVCGGALGGGELS